MKAKALALLTELNNVQNGETFWSAVDGKWQQFTMANEPDGDASSLVWADVPDDIVCFLRTLVEGQVQMLYDDPHAFCLESHDDLKTGIRAGVAMQLNFLKRSCVALNLDWDEVVEQESTEYERQRIDKILSE